MGVATEATTAFQDMADNIKKLQLKAIYCGNGTISGKSTKTFTIKSYYADYSRLKVNNFLFDLKSGQSVGYDGPTRTGSANISKSYNASTGVLSVTIPNADWMDLWRVTVDVYIIV